jgi:HD-GYP domain-containing protein (c-di-GMP phosphodiesterase class II)
VTFEAVEAPMSDLPPSRLSRLVELTRAVAREREGPELLERILLDAKEATRADGGSLYVLDETRRNLEFAVLQNDTLDLHLGGSSGRPIELAPPPLYDAAGVANHRSVVTHCAHSGETVRIADAYLDASYETEGARAFDDAHGYRTRSLLTVPLFDHIGDVIGVLQLVNACFAIGETIAFTEDDQRYIEALTGLAAVSLTQRQLIDRLERLFEGLIELVNDALDEKSPYTGGHCRRVPELLMMLADAAHRAKEGPLAGFRMSERERRELKLAGMLHDCGKITTPVHVVDKATKLQTIYDRIGLIDARFDVLERDAKIAMYEAMDKGVARTEGQAALLAELAQLASDREFLRRANLGSERANDATVARVKVIAARRFRGSDGAMHPLLTDDELANLCIPYGTLNRDEREIINRHITTTIRMLESLPWPSHLRRVPEYAGAHHERVDGKGYPRGLTRAQMSWQARMMGVADVFEALTAKDRPYKPAKTLSESLSIMERMASDGHLDPDLYDLFVREKVYLDYARAFLDPSQIDIESTPARV